MITIVPGTLVDGDADEDDGDGDSVDAKIELRFRPVMDGSSDGLSTIGFVVDGFAVGFPPKFAVTGLTVNSESS